MLLGTLGASLVGNKLAGKEVKKYFEVTTRAEQDFQYPLANFVTQGYYQ